MKNSLNIALVSGYDFSHISGVNDHVSNLATQFQSLGHQVKIIAPCSNASMVSEPFFVPMGRPVPIPSGGSVARVSVSIWLKPRIREFFNNNYFDIIHVHEPFSGALTAFMLSESNGVNIATFHSFKGSSLYEIGGTRLAKPYSQLIHGRIAVSKPASDYIQSYFPGKYTIIPNGINLNNFGTNIKPFPHLKDGMLNLLFLGRLDKRKGLRHLLSAYSKLKWDWPNLRLIVVGGGNLDTESQRILGERNLSDIIFTGQVSASEKARYFKSADIYCSPATGNESFGIVLLEAMASGVPIVASEIEGYSSVITNGSDGLLVPPKNEIELANTLDILLKKPYLRDQLIKQANDTVKRYDWNVVSERIMEYYWKIIHKNIHIRKKGNLSLIK